MAGKNKHTGLIVCLIVIYIMVFAFSGNVRVTSRDSFSSG